MYWLNYVSAPFFIANKCSTAIYRFMCTEVLYLQKHEGNWGQAVDDVLLVSNIASGLMYWLNYVSAPFFIANSVQPL